MKRKMVTIIVAAMMMTSITACGTTNSASAKESVPDTEESFAIDTETEEIETEEPTELAESTEKIEETEVTESTEEEQVAQAKEKVQETSRNSSTTSTNTSNTATQSNSAGSTAGNSSPAATTTPETPAVSTPSAPDTTPAATPDTATSEHEHVWVEHLATGHYEEQVVTAAYDEPVYEEKVVCGCGKIFDTVSACGDHQFNDDCYYSYSIKEVQVGTTHHDAVTQTVWVEDAVGWYDCSICGERSILASHNHN